MSERGEVRGGEKDGGQQGNGDRGPRWGCRGVNDVYAAFDNFFNSLFKSSAEGGTTSDAINNEKPNLRLWMITLGFVLFFAVILLTVLTISLQQKH